MGLRCPWFAKFRQEKKRAYNTAGEKEYCQDLGNDLGNGFREGGEVTFGLGDKGNSDATKWGQRTKTRCKFRRKRR